MSGKRRLSQGSNLIDLPFEEDDEEVDIDDMAEVNSRGNRRMSSCSGRRRSSFGGSLSAMSPTKSAAEQLRIADMYKNVIKLSSENKINEKNSWGLDLIDHMQAIIKEESGNHRGVNFQKASCTLDASIKIYSHRVDDTYATSHRILDSLSRNGAPADDNNDNGEGASTKVAARVGSKTASNRLAISETIEKNIESLNIVRLENDQAADPMFHKMSQAFDEGGAKGMLMTNLRVRDNACAIVFTSDGLRENENHKTSGVAGGSASVADDECVVDISDLIFKSGLSVDGLSLMALCPALDEYRSCLHVPDNTGGVVTAAEARSFAPTEWSSGVTVAAPVMRTLISESKVPFDSAAADDGDDNDDNDCGDYAMHSADEGATGGDSNCSPAKSTASWLCPDDAEQDDNNDHSQPVRSALSSASAAPASSRLSYGKEAPAPWPAVAESIITTGNEYAFIDPQSLMTSNAWAGAMHWKYATRRRAAKEEESNQPHPNTGDSDGENDDDETGDGEKVTKSRKSKKVEAFQFDFSESAEPLDGELFAVAKPSARTKTDSTCLTKAAIDKMTAAAAAGELLLPLDSKLQVRDLCRLSLCSKMIVAPTLLAAPSAATALRLSLASSITSSACVCSDLIWRSAVAAAGPGASRTDVTDRRTDDINQRPEHSSQDYDDRDDNDGDDCDGGGGYGYGDYGDSVADLASAGLVDNLAGLAIDTRALVQASRTVDKVDIGYATVSKRVNVKNLKTDIWQTIDQELTEGTTSGKTASKSELSFQDLVCNIASSSHKQADVTLPFYFICLLHLANEKTLRIDNVKDMSDLIISQDN